MRWIQSIQARLILLAALPVMAVVFLLTVFFVVDRFSRMETELQAHGLALTRQMAAAAEYGVFSGNMPALKSAIHALMRDKEVVAVVVRDDKGPVLLGMLRSGESTAAAEVIRSLSGETLSFAEPVISTTTPLDDLFAADATPQKAIGLVEVAVSRARLRSYRQQVILTVLGIGLAAILLVIVLAHFVSLRLASPIIDLSHAVRRMQEGELATRVTPSLAATEITVLSHGFNRMAAEIEASQRDLENRIAAATRELSERRDEAERANIAKSRFLAAASHDLRQPLQALGLFVDQMLRRPLPASELALAQRMADSVATFGKLFHSLLDVSRLDMEATAPSLTSFPASSLLQGLCTNFSDQAEKSGLSLRCRPSALWLRSDSTMLERILGNFISNAIRHTQRGTILVAVRRRADKLHVEVRDSGVGIPLESQQLIFAEFVQLENPERNLEKGLGLGLSIVERLCRALGYRFGLRSSPGRGSTFWVEVPIAKEEEIAAAQRAVVEHRISDHVAVAIDEPIFLDSLCNLLRSWGCQVTAAADGAALMKLLPAGKSKPDIVICSEQLPDGERGSELIARLRAHHDWQVAAIVVTDDLASDLVDEAARQGIHLLSRTARPARLRALVQSLRLAPASAAPSGMANRALAS